MSQHELFVIDRKPALNEKEATRAAALREKLTIANTLGLKAQAKSLKADIATVERGCLIATPPMTDSELVIWSAWLPTAYTDLPKERNELADYNFDRVPGPVLKMWQEYKKTGLFERFEIWTPENKQPDPILVGVNGNARHLLARWGESDANLVSFDDIKRELVRRWYNNEQIGGEDLHERWARQSIGESAFFTALISSVVIGFLLIAVCKFLEIPAEAAFPTTGVVIVGIGVGSFFYYRRRFTKNVLKSSTLMQAIAKDNSHRELLPATA